MLRIPIIENTPNEEDLTVSNNRASYIMRVKIVKFYCVIIQCILLQ